MLNDETEPAQVADLEQDLGFPMLQASSIRTVTRAQMIEIDRAAIDAYGIRLIQMMENAGFWLAELTRRWLGGSCSGRRIGVLAGRGNNGGGGLVAARRLNLWGAQVEVLLAADPADFSDVPADQLRILQRLALPARRFGGEPLRDQEVLIDAVIGYGLIGVPSGLPLQVIQAINLAGVPVISLDVPSGIDVDNGEAPDEAVHASATLTLALPKVGLLTTGTAPYIGRLFLGDISIPPAAFEALGVEWTNPFAEGPIVEIIREPSTPTSR